MIKKRNTVTKIMAVLMIPINPRKVTKSPEKLRVSGIVIKSEGVAG
jgi:hypothetical protein